MEFREGMAQQERKIDRMAQQERNIERGWLGAGKEYREGMAYQERNLGRGWLRKQG
jgi:hypothetical protein